MAPAALLLILPFVFWGLTGADRLIFLPGTQPGTADTVSMPASSCGACHASANGLEVPIQHEWSGGMMANSARDPLFRAALAVTNKYAALAGENTGEYCIRCHSPSGWLAGRSEDVSGAALRGTDLDGVQCDFCHRLVDPLHPDSTVGPSVVPVPGYGNGMHVVQSSGVVRRGPRDGTLAAHPAMADTFQGSGAFCGVCHDVSNPFQTTGSERIDLPPHAYAPLERTYSEWLMSDYSSEGDSGTCQSCHLSRVPGYAASAAGAPARPDVRSHDLTGGNAFVPRILSLFWDGIDTAATGAAAFRAEATLRRAALLTGNAHRDALGVTAEVRVTNLTGHKLPTGYPEGRRMWLTVVATGASGDTLFASGVYAADSATLPADPFLKVYEAVRGLTAGAAAARGLPAGPSFHFALNDTILFDNRIPPRGFSNAAFAARLAAPVGVAYADGVSWDDAVYPLPPGAAWVHASLWYQTMTREYAEFLRDENEGNAYDSEGWGLRLHEAWELHGKSAPVLMDSVGFAVPDTTTGVAAGPGMPDAYRLDPPWPNPFNGAVTIGYALAQPGALRLDVVDVTGRIVATLADGRRPAGEGTATFSPAPLAGGVYLVRMRAGQFSSSRKILFIP